MHFGEVSVKLRPVFDGNTHLKRSDAVVGTDSKGKLYTQLDLLKAKTTKEGKIQSIFLVRQGQLCPLEALCNLASIVPVWQNNPLFSWKDHR
jgi:hypothetical protein